MANLEVKLTISGNVISDATDISFTNNIGVSNDVAIQRVTCPTGGVQIFDTARGKSYVYIKNNDTETVTIESAASGGVQYMSLEQNEFAYFPWAGTAALYAIGADATAAIEIGIFEN